MRFGGRRAGRRSSVNVSGGGGGGLPMAIVLASGPALALRPIWRAAR